MDASRAQQTLSSAQEKKQLTVKKGKISRQIGEAKKQGKDISDLLAEMQRITQLINALDTEIEQSSQHPQCHPGNTQTTNSTLPARFEWIQKEGSPISTSIEVIEITQNQNQDWNNYVDQHPRSCGYHQYQYRDLITKAFGHQTFYLAAIDTNTQKICGILPAVRTQSPLFGHYITSLPFFNYGGPIADSEEIELELINHLIAIAKQEDVAHIELRECHPRANFHVKSEKVSMFLALPDSEEALAEQLGSKVRAQIKKGQNNNFEFRSGGLELLNDYYQVFSRNMRDLGTPVYAKSLFRHMLECVPGQSTLAVLYHQHQPVSCAFLLGFKDTLEIPWASTIRDANPLNANMVLYWHVLCFAIQKGYRYFDFGRSSKDAPTFKFKKQWGAQPAELYWHYWLKPGTELPQLNPNNPKYRLLIAVWQRLPVFLANLIGPWIVRSLP